MAHGTLTIDLKSLAHNWAKLNEMTACETAAVVKADAYGLGVGPVGRALQNAGVGTFFVASCEEGAELRDAIGSDARIFVFSGHMDGDTDLILDNDLIPLLNSVDQMLVHLEKTPNAPFGIQLDTGMNRLGMEAAEWEAVRSLVLPLGPKLIMSHLACADEPDHPMNAQQLAEFIRMTEGVTAPRSLSATGGIFLGSNYHFDLTRPGVGLYGGLPYIDAWPVAHLDIPIIQTRTVLAGESVGYGNTWIAYEDRTIATIAAGYADGVIRALGENGRLFAGDTACPIVGRISMDMIAVDVTALDDIPTHLELLGKHQSVATVADQIGTIGYEVLTSLGARYKRDYKGA